jgi:hypothetical protein
MKVAYQKLPITGDFYQFQTPMIVWVYIYQMKCAISLGIFVFNRRI